MKSVKVLILVVTFSMMIHMINVFAAVSMFARMLVTFRHNLNFVIVNLDVGNEGCLW